ncbi:YfjP family GTPase [Nocardiopsis alba]|uniref:YfjP family GTPase n=1 Tax=Nocardiopsis alba TaxID=53437 RepID=A0ABV5DV27_9ACTN
MTTQWNPAQAGDTGGGEPRPTGEDTERESTAGPGPWVDDPAPEPTAPRVREQQSGPWRGYTMPVPEHPEHAEERIRGVDDQPAYDGITGYPDPSGAGAAHGALQSGTETRREPAVSKAEPEETRGEGRRRSGRHARLTGEARRAPVEGDHDDPENLAGWVGSLTEAADDARIAGRHTGAFPAIRPEPEPEVDPEPEPAEAEAEAEPDEAVAEQEPDRRGARPAPGAGDPRSQATWVPDPQTDEDGDENEEGEDTGGPSAEDRVPEETGAVKEPDEPEPLPRRVPGPSAVSGAFRAIGPDTTVPERPAEEEATGRTEEVEEEYRFTDHDRPSTAGATTRSELIGRLEALSTLVELGGDDLPEEATGRAGQLLDHAGARLRLSAEHTVVALAGGTGSGKSSLFNALCGLELSQIGVTRPTTSKAHACVWGHEGADALLSWLGVPTRYRHSRTSVLDTGDSALTGLVLLDLPDHDSVRSVHTAEADRLIGSVDLLVWVLDPQKYADAAVHHRYLAKMAGHGAVTVAVLNQVDKVEPEELEELLTDLRRLLETESGVHPRVITTSTLTGQGIDELRGFLGETVGERRALVDRLVADLDQVVEPFEEFRGTGEIPRTVSERVRSRVQEGLADAAGVAAVADVVETNEVRRGKRRVGWPVARRASSLRKDPLAAVQLDFLRRAEPGVGGPVDAHEAELETALGEAADEISREMPSLWRRRMRAAARSGLSELSAELGEAVSGAVGDPDRSPSWWRPARAVQYALLTVAGIGLLWALVSSVSLIGGGITGLRMFDDPLFIAYSGAVVAAGLVVGWLTGVGCGNLVEVAAVQRREEVERTALERVREIAAQRVVAPMEEELERYRAFREAYEAAVPRDRRAGRRHGAHEE